MMDGYKETELARELGRTPSWVSERLSELRQEIQLQNGLLPPLADADYETLKDSIRVHGVRVPVVIGRHVPLIDGRHRLRVCTELEIDCPAVWLDDLAPGEEEELAIALNASRRHLSRQQKRKLVEYELMRDSNRSDRRVASVCGVTHPTVASIRKDLSLAVDTWIEQGLPSDLAPRRPDPAPDPQLDVEVDVEKPVVATRRHAPEISPPTRIDRKGRAQPARRRPGPTPRPAAPLADLECPTCGAFHQLWRREGRYTLGQ